MMTKIDRLTDNVDVTSLLQKTLDGGGRIHIPSGTYYLSDTLRFNTANTTISFGSYTTFVTRGNYGAGFSINAPNVRITNPFRFIACPELSQAERTGDHRAIVINAEDYTQGNRLMATTINGVEFDNWTSCIWNARGDGVDVSNCNFLNVRGTEADYGYGITSSGRHVRVTNIYAANEEENSYGRHVIYFNDNSQNCTAKGIKAKNFVNIPFIARLEGDNSKGILFEDLYAEKCNTQPYTNGGCVTVRNVSGGKVHEVKVNLVTLNGCGGHAVRADDVYGMNVTGLTCDNFIVDPNSRFHKIHFENCKYIAVSTAEFNGINHTNESILYAQSCDEGSIYNLKGTGDNARSVLYFNNSDTITYENIDYSSITTLRRGAWEVV